MVLNLPNKKVYRVGILSDTHGHVSQRVVQHLDPIDLIIHAGDINTPDVLPQLRALAPVVAVRGNMDSSKWSRHLNGSENIRIADTRIYILHDVSRLDHDSVLNDLEADVIISGHTHRPHLFDRNGIVFINPGSASFPRHPASASMAILQIRQDGNQVFFIDLESGCISEMPF